MSIWEVVDAVLIACFGLAVLGCVMYFLIDRIVDRIVFRVLQQYEERVTRQSLDEARRLIDANRTHPARRDAAAPAKIHKARVGIRRRR